MKNYLLVVLLGFSALSLAENVGKDRLETFQAKTRREVLMAVEVLMAGTCVFFAHKLLKSRPIGSSYLERIFPGFYYAFAVQFSLLACDSALDLFSYAKKGL